MAALDYGMALSRGLIAPQKELQAEMKELAGTAFKSDDWWNKQLDRQIKQGVRQYETGTEYKTKSGDYVLGERRRYSSVGYAGLVGPMQTGYAAPQDAVITGYNPGMYFGAGTPRYDKRSVQVVGPDRKDLTTGQLKAIQTQAEQSADKVKREARLAKSKTKRGARGSGGLLGKSTQQDKGLSAKLPELGSMGLGIEKTYLG